ncbi:MAG: hypothetical protein ACKO96_26910, partial [Flammeovirgaceae bacterium]
MKKVLFTVGSLNQVMQMHAIASHLPEYDCYFSQFYSDSKIIQEFVKRGGGSSTILGGQFRENTEKYLAWHQLKNDYAQSIYHNKYDLAVVCSDLLIPASIRSLKSIWVQEGMTDKITPWSRLVRRLGLPGYWAGNTSLNGTSNLCDIYCVASEGYRKHFLSLGADEKKIVVTGMPNFDNVEALQYNNFPHRNFVLVATSDIRELMGIENRPKFIRKCVAIANGRQLIFKLHPNENKKRAIDEINKYTTNAWVYTDGNINEMIYHCDELITQYSTVVYVGIALGKKVHSYFAIDELKKRTPIQNGGRSAVHIAAICRRFLEYPYGKEKFLCDE